MSEAGARHFILGTAGHVDHGKTALVKALTGVDTDRLKEEKARGISIELGFAELPLGPGLVLGVVDVPGHERFVRQMVAGAGGVDLAMLVVAADEGVMPQTVEHLEILVSLGVRGGLVALTKTDLVDADLAEVAAAEVQELAAGTFLAGRPVVPVSAVTGQGLEELRRALRGAALALPARGRGGPFRLPVDRVFSLPGVGVIVTGTGWSGEVATGDVLTLAPGGQKVRVREVQAHGAVVPRGGSGQRLALALHGVKKEEVARGDQVATPGTVAPSERLDARVWLAGHWTGALKNRLRLHVHHAGREVLGRITLLDAEELGGERGPRSGLAQLALEEPLMALPGDRLVLRFYSPVTTVGGGEVLAVAAPRRRRFDEAALAALAVLETGDPAAVFRQQLREAGLAGLARQESAAHAGDPQAVAVLDRLCHREVLLEAAARVGALVAEHGRRYPLRAGIPKEEARRRLGFAGGRAEWNALLEAMAGLSAETAAGTGDDGSAVAAAAWAVAGDRIVAAGGGPALAPNLAAALAVREEALRACGLQWPGLDPFREQMAASPAHGQAEEEYLKHLVERGRAVQAGSDYYVHAEPLAGLLAAVREHFRRAPELSFGDFRALSGLSRKLGIPMLEHLDASGVTVRAGDLRRPGPALGAGTAG